VGFERGAEESGEKGCKSKDPKCRSVCSEKSKRAAMVQVMRWNKGMETPRIGYGYVF
jgi:hypothetical protein